MNQQVQRLLELRADRAYKIIDNQGAGITVMHRASRAKLKFPRTAWIAVRKSEIMARVANNALKQAEAQASQLEPADPDAPA